MITRPATTADRTAGLARLAWGNPGESTAEARASAIDELRREHAAWAQVDLDRLHPSWLIRALRQETAAVQRAVIAQVPPAIAESLKEGLGLADVDLVTDHPPHPDALVLVFSLWSERLLGGSAPRPEEPAVVGAVAGTDRVERRRLFDLLGLAKWAYAASTLPADMSDHDRLELSHFKSLWGEPEPRLVHLAKLDLRSAGDPGIVPAKLALITIGRLLGEVEPARARWLLQHLPYEAAKWTRVQGQLENPVVSRRALIAWESRILAAAMDRLASEVAEGANR